MNNGVCFLCKGVAYENDGIVYIGNAIAHQSCHEAEMEDYAEFKEMGDQWRAQQKRDNKLIRRLKRTLKPKIFACFEMIADFCMACDYLEIVSVADVRGEKVRGNYYFGESVAVRHVYDDTQTDYWGDGFSGDIYLPIGHGRYLHMNVRG